MGKFGVGQALRRVEDQRFLTGEGRYCDDISLPGQAVAVLLRSPHAHAELGAIDAAEARAAPGVLGVFTAEDLAAEGIGDIPCLAPVKGKGGQRTIQPPKPVLARGRVRHVGDPVALVVAETRAQAQDAADLVAVDYVDLPAVVGSARALAPDAPRLHDEAPGNLAVDWELGDATAASAAFEAAAHVTRIELVNNRIVVAALEPRAALGQYDAESGRFTLTTSTQGSHRLLGSLSRILDVPRKRIRVLTPDVGGGFGMKIFCYNEQVLVLWAARRLGRPVKWTGERQEGFLSDTQGRDHVTTAELALDAEGRFLAIRTATLADMGAYLSPFAPVIPTEVSAIMLPGLYRMPAVYAEVKCVFTNSVPVDAYRGAGRPEAAYVVERLVDAAARQLGLSPVELRQRNMIAPEELPHTTVTGLAYDSGDFAQILDQALSQADWAGAAERKTAARTRGLYRGIGLATYIESCGGVGEEDARVRLDSDGGLTVYVGTQTNGQGHATAYTQLLAERFGLAPELIRVRQGDSDDLAEGGGTGGSRSLLMGGQAIKGAGGVLIDKARRLAGQMLEAAEADIEFLEGVFTVAGTNFGIGLAALAEAAAGGTGPDGRPLPEDLAGSLEGAFHQGPQARTFPNGCHVCEVTVDPETGAVDVERYVVVDDFGTVINPLLCASQIHGGIAQGLGQALFEHTVYDPESGQLLSGSFMDYCLPRADDLPALEVTLVEDFPCATNALGVKGAGEAGAIGAPPALINALVDALAPLGVRTIDMPATPERVWRAIRDARAAETSP
ncbi:MAG: xanthine dehydrogenase family protein molybdopterin-binding subunit [Rhodospirillales bacterium]|nr:xanthine dehydrogenase family protein molybdopterin-binding subunit [Rhodospirillales bacterium]MDH3917420.1 xanthine dehydrogenase family protein molybdopterin-binding subunit [Rhodospirillales bacterium]MDH3969118.1 xanthine dehydrogenase family protein molybdopterin-binding subunit [Rhodospirillales bacterium]